MERTKWFTNKRKIRSSYHQNFHQPFIGVLTGLAVISLVIDVLMAEPGEQEWTGVVIIAVMVVCSAILRFWQEWKANEATDSLMKMVKNTCLVKRAGSGEEELDITELVPGDIVFLAAGDMIPADLRIIESKDLFISQASLTGESEPIEKFPEVKEKQYRKGSIVELDNICYMGSTVIVAQPKVSCLKPATGLPRYYRPQPHGTPRHYCFRQGNQ